MPYPRLHRSIAFKLYLTVGLALAGALSLTIVSTHFAQRTREATSVFMTDGVRASSLASRLELLLQQHRDLVENASASLDQERLASAQSSLHMINGQLVALVSLLQSAKDDSIRGLGGQLGRELPWLVSKGDNVLGLTPGLAQDQSLDAAKGPYAATATLVQREISRWREQREAILKRQSEEVSASADRLISSVLACAAAVLVFASFALLVGQRQLRRLEQLKQCLLRLADRDTTVDVPSLGTRDEIGAIARAIQSFKENAITVAAQDAALKESAHQLETALGNMSQGLCLFDVHDRLQLSNRRFCDIFGFDHTKICRGMSYRDVLQLSLQAGNLDEAMLEDRLAQLRAGRLLGEPYVTMQRLAHGRDVAISRCFMDDDGWVLTVEDITARRAAEDKITFMARHDALTNLPNRVVLNEWLEHAVVQAGRGTRSAVLCLDLDRFKAVNDTLGHPVGDALLRAASDRLLALVREADMVARLGGDEFAIVQNNIQRPEDAKLLSERIVAVLSAPFEIDGHQVIVGVSIGIALAPDDGTQAEKLLRNADMALYRAKSDGRGRFCFFEPDMDARLQHRRQLEFDLRSALTLSQFELFYQPLVNLEHGEVSGFEALIRWRHPERGLVSPADFIPIIEDTGLIVPVGEWVIRQACSDAALWPGKVKVAVNLSPAQFKSEQLAPTIAEALADSGLPAQRLELEITESVLLQDNEETLSTLHTLRDLGVKIAMDDFGTGYSSLSYLRSFPFDKVKIDQSFIRDLLDRKDSVHVVRAVTGLCDGLGMVTTAEGVETAEQLLTLQNEGCTEAQGYFFSRPKPVEHVPAIIASVRAATHYGPEKTKQASFASL